MAQNFFNQLGADANQVLSPDAIRFEITNCFQRWLDHIQQEEIKGRPRVEYVHFCGYVPPKEEIPPVIIDPKPPTPQDECLETINKKTEPPMTYELGFSETPNSKIVANGYTTFFVNSKEKECPIVSCNIRTKGCGSAYLGTNLRIVGSPPVQI